jgi:cytochrome b561
MCGQWKNSARDYGTVSKCLHWVVALCVVAMVPLGFSLSFLEGEDKNLALAIHKSLGVIVLGVVVLRILWRLYSRPPQLPVLWAPVVKTIAAMNHRLLYLLTLGMPLSGWAMSSAFGKAVIVPGWGALPMLVAKNLPLALALKEAHAVGGFILTGLVTLHVTAALYHGLILKDGVMKRML